MGLRVLWDGGSGGWRGTSGREGLRIDRGADDGGGEPRHLARVEGSAKRGEVLGERE